MPPQHCNPNMDCTIPNITVLFSHYVKEDSKIPHLDSSNDYISNIIGDNISNKYKHIETFK